MTSKEAKTHIIDTLNGDMNKECFINELLPEILKDLDRLEELLKENQELKDTNMKYAKLIDDFQAKNMRLEKAIEIIEKELKVLEIIKNKCVNVNTLINCIIGAIEPLEFYNEKVSTNLKLTKDEYELLKGVLEYDLLKRN